MESVWQRVYQVRVASELPCQALFPALGVQHCGDGRKEDEHVAEPVPGHGSPWATNYYLSNLTVRETEA